MVVGREIRKGLLGVFPACELCDSTVCRLQCGVARGYIGWRAMNSTLTASLSPACTQHVCVCAAMKTARVPYSCNPFVLQTDVPSLVRVVATPPERRSAPSDQISTIESCGRRSRTE